MTKFISVSLQFIIKIEATGDTKELIEQEVNNMLYQLERKWHPEGLVVLNLEVKEDD